MPQENETAALLCSDESVSNHPQKTYYGTISKIENAIQIQEDPTIVTKCSVLETSCNVIAVITGSGMLSLPFAAKSMGWSAFFALIFLGLLFMYSFQLLVESIDFYHSRYDDNNPEPTILPPHQHHEEGTEERKHREHVDYITLGKISFGSIGEKIVLLVFAVEMLLALTSFFINIGLNLHFIFPSVSVTIAIIGSAIVTTGLALFELNVAAYSSALGLLMMIFTVIALIWSGVAFNHIAEEKEYVAFEWEGLSLSLGLIAFCFGGHATFPKMYESMAQPHRYREVIVSATIVILFIYATFLVLGYYFFAQYTLAPVTLNIGTDLNPANHQYGKLLRRFAAIGVISNLQVTCPLVTLPLRDVLLKVMDLPFHSKNLQIMSTSIVLLAMILSLSLQGEFAATCAFVGAVATFTNSIILPILFHFILTGSSCTLQRRVCHLGILVIAFACAFSAIYSNFEAIFKHSNLLNSQ